MKIIRLSHSLFPCQKWRSQKTRVCGWKKINRRRGEERGVRDGRKESLKLKEDGQKKKTDARRKLMRGYWRRMGWRGKAGNGLTRFEGENVTARMSHRKKDKSTERCLSKLGNCPPWYLSHSNLISPNKLLFFSQRRIIPSLPLPSSPTATIIIHLTGGTSLLRQKCAAVYWMFTSIRSRIRGSEADAPPWVTGPTSFPLHLRPPPLFPLIPLPHCREDRNADSEPGRWRTQNTLNIFTVTSISSLNRGVLQYVGSNYFDCRCKKKKKKKINVKCKCASSLWQHLVQLLSPAAPTRSCAQCSQQPQPSEQEHSNQARGILHDLWG